MEHALLLQEAGPMQSSILQWKINRWKQQLWEILDNISWGRPGRKPGLFNAVRTQQIETLAVVDAKAKNEIHGPQTKPGPYKPVTLTKKYWKH